jgi:ATP-binding cassette subfamily C protein
MLMRRATEAGLDSLTSVPLGGRMMAAGANAPIRIADADTALIVLEGHVDVFILALDRHGDIVSRHSLYRAVEGDLVAGLPADRGEADGRLAIEAVGTVGSSVLADVEFSGIDRLPPDRLTAMLDRLCGSLLGAFERARPDRETRVIGPGEAIELYRDVAAFAPGRRPVWVGADSDLHLFGDRALAARNLPVTSACWVESPDGARVAGREMSELVTAGEWHDVFRAFLAVCRDGFRGLIGEADAAILRQLEDARDADGKAISRALAAMASTVGAERHPEGIDGIALDARHRAFLAAGRSIGIAACEAPRPVRGANGLDPVEALALTYHVRTRKVLLRDRWWTEDNGPLLAEMGEASEPVALLPTASGYLLFDPDDGSGKKVTAAIAEELGAEAVMLYEPLPEHLSGLGDMVRFMWPKLRPDLRRIAMMGVLGGVIAAFTPVMTGMLIEKVLPRSDLFQHFQIIIALAAAAFGAAVFEVVKSFAILRIESRTDLVLQAAVFDRLLRLPVRFFRGYTAGDLTDRVLGIQTIRQTLTGTTLQSLLGIVFTSFSLVLLFYYSWKLAIVATGMVALAIALMAWLGMRQLEHERERVRHQGKAEGFVLQMIAGLSKLRAAAAEKRAYARWAGFYTAQKRRFVKAQQFANHQDLLQAMFPVLSAGIIFIAASVFIEDAMTQVALDALVAESGEEPDAVMSTGDFVAFNAAFGQFLLAMTALAVAITRSLVVFPLFERLRPIVEAEPEVLSSNRPVEQLQGGIEVSQVGFRYAPGTPMVLDNLSLTIEPNEFVAIVGPSGSGKSTLVRLLLGFETPESGEILFDGTPQRSLDLASLRRQLQVVLQHGKLTHGSIFTNIVGARKLSLDDAWQAARQAGIDKDIEALPMGMHTVVMEGVNTLSGGQRQRLMIARALVNRPGILLLDEPTSALDNTTQEIVMTSLRNLNATRILIAHRLSTVRHVDRILVMEGGRLVQSGSYDELMAVPGIFADMARRQSVQG